MKYALSAIAYNIGSIVFAVAAGVLAFYDKPGWGWCIVGAILLHTTVSWNSKKDDADEDED